MFLRVCVTYLTSARSQSVPTLARLLLLLSGIMAQSKLGILKYPIQNSYPAQDHVLLTNSCCAVSEGGVFFPDTSQDLDRLKETVIHEGVTCVGADYYFCSVDLDLKIDFLLRDHEGKQVKITFVQKYDHEDLAERTRNIQRVIRKALETRRALGMSQHPRLGQDSPLRLLNGDTLSLIMRMWQT